MATVPNIIAELGHMHDWVNTQIGCGLDPASCAHQQYDNLTAKISSISTIGTDDATELVSQIRANAMADWTPGQLAALCSLVGTKCLGNNTGDGKRWQEVIAFPRFLTKQEVSSLKSGMLSQRAMVKTVVTRAHRLGMCQLSEAAKGHIAAVVATAMGIELQGQPWYDLLQKVKGDLVKLKAATWRHRTIWLYDNPSDLVAEPWYESAYPDGDGPSDDAWEIDRPDVLRSNNKKSGKRGAVQDSAPKAAPPMHSMNPAEMVAYQNMFGQGMAAAVFAAASQGPPWSAASSAPQAAPWSAAASLAPPPKATAPPPAPPAATPPPAPEPAPEPKLAPEPKPAADEEPPDLSGEEAALRKSIATRSVLRRPAGAQKRPAAAGADADDAELCDDDDDAAPAAAAMTAMKGAKNTMKATKVAKRSGHVAVQKKPAKKPSKLPQPPKEGDPPLSYRAGYVSTNWSSSMYRAVVGRSDKRIRWDTGAHTRNQAFAEALKFIDQRS